jgi:hypothetical protein
MDMEHAPDPNPRAVASASAAKFGLRRGAADP